jgi:hypothetical protein
MEEQSILLLDVTPFSPVEVHQTFEGTYYPHMGEE